MPPALPEHLRSYRYVEQGGKAGFVLESEAGALIPLLFADAGPGGSEEAGGRGRVLRFELASGGGIFRRYRRGGLAARVLADGYLGNRMRREFELTAWLYAAGGAVPQPLGVVWSRRGLLYRGAIATRAIAGDTLLARLQRGEADSRLLGECGRVIRVMHDLGVWHADLQALNILAAGGSAWLIDFDNARRMARVSHVARARNLLRLRRSLEKHGQSLDNFDVIRAGYGNLGLPRWLDFLYRLRGLFSDTLHG
ncbi:MAG: 3-deoxy-D-manno-octulosonic acid kinase [Candidatus Hydrogenedentes bacterium]|nr:3-deoxy-D-manno-octulosonic acid kinase [Candidatus Hydrogenedentota bacterium]